MEGNRGTLSRTVARIYQGILTEDVQATLRCEYLASEKRSYGFELKTDRQSMVQ